jgi:hypothetical protein
MGFKISIDGLELLKAGLKTDESLRRVIPDMSLAVLHLHNTLESRVGELFTSKNSLSSVMIGHSIKPDQVGNTFLRYSLQYRRVPEPLANFKTSINNSSSLSAIPWVEANGWVKWTRGEFSKETLVSVRRGRKEIPTLRDRKGFTVNGKIRVRKQDATWRKFPGVALPQGERKGMTKMMFGPTLSELASKVYDKDTQVAAAKEKVTTDMIRAFTNFY